MLKCSCCRPPSIVVQLSIFFSWMLQEDLSAVLPHQKWSQGLLNCYHALHDSIVNTIFEHHPFENCNCHLNFAWISNKSLGYLTKDWNLTVLPTLLPWSEKIHLLEVSWSSGHVEPVFQSLCDGSNLCRKFMLIVTSAVSASVSLSTQIIKCCINLSKFFPAALRAFHTDDDPIQIPSLQRQSIARLEAPEG